MNTADFEYQPAPSIGISARKASKSNVNKYKVEKFGGTQEIARRKSQIKRGIICVN